MNNTWKFNICRMGHHRPLNRVWSLRIDLDHNVVAIAFVGSFEYISLSS